jgi:hypothetical protein
MIFSVTIPPRVHPTSTTLEGFSMPSFRPHRRSLAALLALGGLLSGAGLASAAASRIVRPVTDAPAPAPPAASPAPMAPQGGHVLPFDVMRETSPGVYEGIVPKLMSDGSWQVDLDERFHAFSVARLGEGGRLMSTCVHGAGALARWQAFPAMARADDHDHGVRPAVSGPQATPATVTKWEAR